jgi:hypothetical protein
MPTTLLLAHPDLKTQRYLCCITFFKQFWLMISLEVYKIVHRWHSVSYDSFSQLIL